MFRRRTSQTKPISTEAPSGDSVVAAWDPAAVEHAGSPAAPPMTAANADGVEPGPIPDPIEPEDLTEPAAGTTQAAEVLIDERLVKNAQKGELASFNTLVSRHER